MSDRPNPEPTIDRLAFVESALRDLLGRPLRLTPFGHIVPDDRAMLEMQIQVIVARWYPEWRESIHVAQIRSEQGISIAITDREGVALATRLEAL